MHPRKRLFLIIGVSFIVVMTVGFALRVVTKVADDQWLDTYYSGTYVPWTYGSAFIVMTLGLIVLLVGGVAHLHRWRVRRRSERDASSVQPLPPE